MFKHQTSTSPFSYTEALLPRCVQFTSQVASGLGRTQLVLLDSNL